MRFSIVGLVSGLLLFCMVLTLWAAAPPKGWKLYQGNMFNIFYPANFTPRPKPDREGNANTDSAFFLSPDQAVEFYVFSPQWSGEPEGIKLNPKTEILVSTKTQKKQIKNDKGEVTDTITYCWKTIRAKNKSYTRSIYDETTTSTRKTFGYKYANQATYDKYLGAYQQFKKSLVQYAD
ncbi:MAG TPA: hypothetical protein VGM23_06800 [Armatimonadota bacterium]|jgi:hypothetical protein